MGDINSLRRSTDSEMWRGNSDNRYMGDINSLQRSTDSVT